MARLVARSLCFAALVPGFGLGCAAGHQTEEVTAPPDPAAVGGDGGVMARRLTPEQRAAEVGRKLGEVRPGMTRREVEALLGPPDRDAGGFTARWEKDPDGEYVYVELPLVHYYASSPNLPPGVHVMAVAYRGKPLAPIPPDAVVAEVTGPHTPGLPPPRDRDGSDPGGKND